MSLKNEKMKKKKKLNQPAELLCVPCLALLNDVNEVVCKYERYTLPLDAKLRLEVAQDVTEVNVKELRQKSKRENVSKHTVKTYQTYRTCHIGRQCKSVQPVQCCGP